MESIIRVSFVYIFLFLVCFSWIHCQPVPTRGYVYQQIISSQNPYFEIRWNVNTVSGELDVAIICNSTSAPGYCSIGFSNSSDYNAIGADAIIGSPGLFYDFLIKRNLVPSDQSCPIGVCVDTWTSGCVSNVYNNISFRSDNFLVLEFTRPLNASDACDRPVTLDSSTDLIWAVGDGYPPDYIVTHTYRGRNISFNWLPPFITTSPITTSPITSGQITSEAMTSDSMTTNPLTSGLMTSGAETSSFDSTTQAYVTTESSLPMSTGFNPPSPQTTGSDNLQTQTTGMTVVVTSNRMPDATSGIATSGASTSDSNSTASNQAASSGDSVINGSNATGLKNWVLALIVIGAILLVVTTIIVIVVVVKKKKQSNKFGGFY